MAFLLRLFFSSIIVKFQEQSKYELITGKLFQSKQSENVVIEAKKPRTKRIGKRK